MGRCTLNARRLWVEIQRTDEALGGEIPDEITFWHYALHGL